jgi:hypothetical protein
MNRILTIALAVMLALLINSPGYAQQPAPAYRFAAVLASGANVGGQILPTDTTIDNTVFADTGIFAAAVHWADPAGGEHSAVLTPQRIVVKSGDSIEGRTILHITSPAIAMNNAGLVAFEATFADARAGGISRTGVFIEHRFMIALDTSAGTAADFTLTEDARIIPTAGTIAPAFLPAPVSGGQKPSQNSAPPPKVPKFLQGVIDKARPYSPVNLPNAGDPIPLPSAAPNPPAAPAPAAQIVTQPAKPALSCPLPPFPTPQEWEIGAEVKGPVAAHAFDQAGNNRSYNSPFFGHMASPFRTVQFGPDCKPLLISIGDTYMRGKFEIWTGSGILTWVQPDGSLNLNGFSEKAAPGNLLRADTPIRVNRRGQVLLPVTTGGSGFAILLANPLGGVN